MAYQIAEHSAALLTLLGYILLPDAAVVDQEDVAPIFLSSFPQDVSVPFCAGLLGPIPLSDTARHSEIGILCRGKWVRHTEIIPEELKDEAERQHRRAYKRVIRKCL